MSYMGTQLAFATASTLSSPLSQDEVMAIDVGIADGQRALRRSRLATVVRALFHTKEQPLANASLEILRSFAETAAIVIKGGRNVSLALLEAQGFSSIQIAAVLAIVTARMATAR